MKKKDTSAVEKVWAQIFGPRMTVRKPPFKMRDMLQTRPRGQREAERRLKQMQKISARKQQEGGK